MDESTLHKAHRAAIEADKAILSRRPRDAIALYNTASTLFETAKAMTQDPEALRMLDILHVKYSTLTKHLQAALDSEPELFKDADRRSLSRPVPPVSTLATSLASARGKPVSNTIEGQYVTVKHRTGSLSTGRDTDEAFAKFNASLEASLNKLQQAVAKPVSELDALRRSQPSLFKASWQDVQESFYVVPDSRIRNHDDAALIGAEFIGSITMCENLVRRQREVMRTSLGKLRQDVRAHESRRTRELESEIERLVAENEKLKVANGRLRKRWESLEESAKKRRGAQSGNTIAEEEESEEVNGKK